MNHREILNRAAGSVNINRIKRIWLKLAIAALLSSCGNSSMVPNSTASNTVESAPVPVPSADRNLSVIKLVNTSRLSERLIEYTFHTESLNAGFLLSASGCCSGETHVRVLLPQDYEISGDRRYPVLYLLHGGSGTYRDWTVQGNAEAVSQPFPVIVVMPDGGFNGYYSDWYNYGAYGPPLWETFHLYELLPWIDANLRTVASRSGRAVAGLSMGGFGTMSYAARHPDFFVAAASFSGTVDNEFDYHDGSPLDGGRPLSIWGPHETEEVRWRTHSPVHLAENLVGLQLTLRTRNGFPSNRYGGTNPDPVEFTVHEQNVVLHDRLDSLGIAHEWIDEGPGCHCWNFWESDLQHTLVSLQPVFANPPAEPVPFSYTSAEPQYTVYGWRVTIERKNMEFSRLSNVRADGFVLEGSGVAQILTAPWYRPNESYEVSVSKQTAYRTSTDSLGRLSLRIPLGPTNETQQYTAAALIKGTSVFKSVVSIRKMGS